MTCCILPAVLVFMWLVYLWETYLAYRQHKVYRETRTIPKELAGYIDEKALEKARSYQLDHSLFGFWSSLYGQCEGTLLLLVDGFFYLWLWSGYFLTLLGFPDGSHEIKQSLVFILICMTLSTISHLPWSLYSTFVIEERHGFNKQTLGFYFKDLLKKTAVSLVIALPITAILIWIIKWGGEYFFFYAWLFALGVSLFMLAIYHDYIAPIFDTFIPLPAGALRDAIEKLAAGIKFPLGKIFVVEGSKRSSHSNAYFFGFYKQKVIVLFDTLLRESPFVKRGDEATSCGQENTSEIGGQAKSTQAVTKGCTDEEIVAILGHELGHWKLNHTVKNFVIGQVNLFASLFVFGLLMHESRLYESFGFPLEKPVIIGMVIIFQFIFSPYNEVMSFLLTVLSRRFEFQADAFGRGLGHGVELQSALIKLHQENLGFPVCDRLYSAYHYSHPPLLERLRALQDDGKKKLE